MKMKSRLQFDLIHNFAERSIFPGGSSLATYPITSDDVYGARNQGFSEELVCVSWRILAVICANVGGTVNVKTTLDKAESRLVNRRPCSYNVALESRWWYYAAAAVPGLSRRPQLRRGGRWSWIRAPSFCRCFPRRRKSPPGWPGPPGPWTTASAAPKTTRRMWACTPRQLAFDGQIADYREHKLSVNATLPC